MRRGRPQAWSRLSTSQSSSSIQLLQSLLFNGGKSGPLIGLVLGGAAGLAAGLALSRREESERLPSERGSQHGPPSGDPILATTGTATPSVHFQRVSENFVAEYDAATRNPRWVTERLTRTGLTGNVERGSAHFKEESALPQHIRSRLGDYLHSGYDRGHLAPAADQHAGKAAMADSFYLSNVSPQVGAGFNRDYWARLEKLMRDVALDDGVEEVLVVSGPLFLPVWKPAKRHKSAVAAADAGDAGDRSKPRVAVGGNEDDANAHSAGGKWAYQHAAIGGPLHWIAVPSHFFKVVLVKQKPSLSTTRYRPYLLGAFVVPNSVIPPDTPLIKFSVPVRAVEAAAGLLFFRDLMGDAEKRAVDAAGLSLMTAPNDVGGRSGSVVITPLSLEDALSSATGGPRGTALSSSSSGGGGSYRSITASPLALDEGRARFLQNMVPSLGKNHAGVLLDFLDDGEQHASVQSQARVNSGGNYNTAPAHLCTTRDYCTLPGPFKALSNK